MESLFAVDIFGNATLFKYENDKKKKEITEKAADREWGRIRFTFFRLNDTRFDPNSTRV